MPDVIKIADVAGDSKVIKIAVVSARAALKPTAEGESIVVSASKPANFTVKGNQVKETGGNVGEAVARAEAKSGSFFSSSIVNGKYVINGVTIPEPDTIEELVIEVPACFAGRVEISSRFYSSVSIASELKGELEASADMGGRIEMADQPALAAAELTASASAKLHCGNIRASGKVTGEANAGGEITHGDINAAVGDLTASSSGSIKGSPGSAIEAGKFSVAASGARVTFDKLTSAAVSLAASASGRINGGQIKATGTADADASAGGKIDFDTLSGDRANLSVSSSAGITGNGVGARSRIEMKGSAGGSIQCKDACVPNLRLNASVSSRVTLDNADVQRLSANASVGGKIEVASGSADGGSAEASVSGSVKLTGEFRNIQQSKSVGGRVTVERNVGNVADRYTRAAKRGFNRDAHGTKLAGVVSLMLAASLAQLESAETTPSDEATISAICEAITKVYTQGDVHAAILKTAELWSTKVDGKVEVLKDPAQVQQLLTDAEVASNFQSTYVLFIDVLKRVAG